MNHINKKYIYIALVAVLGVLVAVFFYLEFTKARLTISTQSEAEIFVSDGRQREFEKIGTTTATFTTRTYGTVFVRVARDGAATERPVQIEGRGSQQVTVDLKELRGSEQIVSESFSYPHFEGNFVYGINPGTRSLSFENQVNDRLPDNLFVDIPYVDKIVWGNANNFVYRSPIEGVGLFIGGEKTPPPYINEGSTRYFDFAKHPDRPLVLLDGAGLYKTGGTSLSSNSIEQIKAFSFNGDASLFADSNYIYFTNSIFDDAAGEGGNPQVNETVITVFDYQGREQYTFTVETSPQPISNVVNLNDDVFLALGESDVLTLHKASDAVSKDSFHFSNTQDLIATNGSLYLLSDTGLWEYEPESASFYKVSGYPDGEEYVKKSLTLFGNNQALLYSTSPQLEALREGRRITGGIYRVNLR